MYQCFTMNAGPYIKLGQMVGQMQMLLPKEYCEAFEPMCMNAPRTPFDEVKKIVEEDLGRPLDEVFEGKFLSKSFIEFDPKPLASASLA